MYLYIIGISIKLFVITHFDHLELLAFYVALE